MRRTILFAAALTALTAGGVFARHDDDCRHDRRFHGRYRDDADDDGRYEHRRELPPGLERQLERNGHLPPGLEKKMHPVPEVIVRRLPPVPEGCMRGYYGGHVIVYNPRTFLIVNVFAGISLTR